MVVLADAYILLHLVLFYGYFFFIFIENDDYVIT